MPAELENWLNSFSELNNSNELTDVTSSKEYKLDLFKDVLPSIDKRDINFFRNLSDEQRKEAEKSLWLYTRYISFSDTLSEHYILMANEMGNINSSLLRKSVISDREGHPELHWMLLCICATGKRKFYGKLPISKKALKNKLQEEISKHFPLFRDDEIDLLLSLNSVEEFRNFFKKNGYDDSLINEILKSK